MTASAQITRFFGEGDFAFALTIGPAQMLEEVRGEALRKQGFDPGHAGLMAIQSRLATGTFLIEDIKQPLRLGLIGAGMDREDAARLVDRHVVSGYIIKAAMVAGDVLDACLSGVPDDQPGADQLGEAKGAAVPIQPASPTAASAGAGSSAKAAPSASALKKSAAPRSGKSRP